MQKDKEFLKNTQRSMPNHESFQRNTARKQAITDHGYDEIPAYELGEESKLNADKYRSIAHAQDQLDGQNIRLDSRINPRKSIILDISIINRNNGVLSKSVKNKTSHKIHGLEKKENSLFPAITGKRKHKQILKTNNSVHRGLK